MEDQGQAALPHCPLHLVTAISLHWPSQQESKAREPVSAVGFIPDWFPPRQHTYKPAGILYVIFLFLEWQVNSLCVKFLYGITLLLYYCAPLYVFLKTSSSSFQLFALPSGLISNGNIIAELIVRVKLSFSHRVSP